MNLLKALKIAYKNKDKAPYAIILFLLIFVSVQDNSIKKAELDKVKLKEAIVSLNTALAAKPKVLIKKEIKWKTKIVKGPVRIITQTVYKKDGGKTVTKEVYRDRIVKEFIKENEERIKKAPLCTSHIYTGLESKPKRWLLGASLAPWSSALKDSLRLSAGVTIFNRLDLVYSYEPWSRSAFHHVGANFRF